MFYPFPSICRPKLYTPLSEKRERAIMCIRRFSQNFNPPPREFIHQKGGVYPQRALELGGK